MDFRRNVPLTCALWAFTSNLAQRDTRVVVANGGKYCEEVTCVHWETKENVGKLLFYQDTAVFPIGISIPASLVGHNVPRKVGPIEAPFLGSSKGGTVAEYTFGPEDELQYHAFYRRHRFAPTRKKGGWDSLRHAEIMAAGTVPIFEGLEDAPPFAVPFLPKQALLTATRLLSYSKQVEAVYNATVLNLLRHTRCCLTTEAMAEHLLRVLDLWPVTRPLRLLYVACGWGWQSLDDGWQGPVSIGLFLGLHALLRRIQPASRIIDAPAGNNFLWEHTRGSQLWYTFASEDDSRFKEGNLRSLMYGYGYSYARRIPREAMATEEERDGVEEALRRRDFDAVIYGKVGPTQGCDPLPFIEELLAAQYPPERVALVYGGDFGLSNKNISTHVRFFGGIGKIFIREMDPPQTTSFKFLPSSVLPSACYLQEDWRRFFKLWGMRLQCWGCVDIDMAVRDALVPQLRSKKHARITVWRGGLSNESLHVGVCWSGLALLSFALLASRETPLTQSEAADIRQRDCEFAHDHIKNLLRLTDNASVAADFQEAFGLHPFELRFFFCSACSSLQAICRDGGDTNFLAEGIFDADFDGEGAGRKSLADLRSNSI